MQNGCHILPRLTTEQRAYNATKIKARRKYSEEVEVRSIQIRWQQNKEQNKKVHQTQTWKRWEKWLTLDLIILDWPTDVHHPQISPHMSRRLRNFWIYSCYSHHSASTSAPSDAPVILPPAQGPAGIPSTNILNLTWSTWLGHSKIKKINWDCRPAEIKRFPGLVC